MALRFFAVVLTALVAVSVVADEVITLNDGNFEHLTQASTGATTGAWLIKFYAPWCGHCKKLAPTWETLAETIHGSEEGRTASVAKVDVTTSPQVGSRFDIQGYPQIMMMDKGKTYKFEGARSEEALLAFANGGYLEQEGTDVPAAPTFADDMQKHLEHLKQDGQELLDTKKNAVVFIFTAGLMFGFVLARLLG